MKIILLVGIVVLCFANILADKTITCETKPHYSKPACRFSGITIGENETVVIETDPRDFDVNRIEWIDVGSKSSIYSIPRAFFIKFPRAGYFDAPGQGIHEVKPDTFVDAGGLVQIDLSGNALTYLHPKTFKGKIQILKI
jgi:hypothetical protein